jgi:hypothetical protein
MLNTMILNIDGTYLIKQLSVARLETAHLAAHLLVHLLHVGFLCSELRLLTL